MGVTSAISKLAKKSLKIKGGVRQGGKSKWVTSGTPENEKRKTARKNFKKKVVQHIEESDARASGPQITSMDKLNKRGEKALDTLMTGKVDAKNYTPGQRRAAEQLVVSQRIGQRKIDQLKTNPKPPAPMDLLTSKKVIKGNPPQRRSQKEEVVIATAKTKKSQVLANPDTGTPAKLRALPSGIENVQGVSGTNPFSEKVATGSSGKIQKRMKTYQESSRIKSAGYKAREELKSATPQQLSDAHAAKGPKPKPPPVDRDAIRQEARDAVANRYKKLPKSQRKKRWKADKKLDAELPF